MKKITKIVPKVEIDPIDASVGRQLRTRRTLMSLSQEDLANKVGLTFQQIQKYENGKNRVSASRLYELGICLDVPVAYFFEGVQDSSQRVPSSPSVADENVLNSKETLELVKAFYSVKNPQVRSKLLKMLKSLSIEVTKKTQGHQ